MNRTAFFAVHLSAILCGAGACVPVDGGAVEAGWVINTNGSGIRIDCDCARIGAVRLGLTAQDATPAPCDERCVFDCERGVGTTDFFVPAGRYAISVVPLDLEGQPLGPEHGVLAPPPVVREVRQGELTYLGVMLFAVDLESLAGRPACEEDWLQPVE